MVRSGAGSGSSGASGYGPIAVETSELRRPINPALRGTAEARDPPLGGVLIAGDEVRFLAGAGDLVMFTGAADFRVKHAPSATATVLNLDNEFLFVLWFAHQALEGLDRTAVHRHAMMHGFVRPITEISHATQCIQETSPLTRTRLHAARSPRRPLFVRSRRRKFQDHLNDLAVPLQAVHSAMAGLVTAVDAITVQSL